MDDVLIRMVSVLGSRADVQALAASVGNRKVNEALDSLEVLAATWCRQGLVPEATLEEVRRIIFDLRQDVKEGRR